MGARSRQPKTFWIGKDSSEDGNTAGVDVYAKKPTKDIDGADCPHCGKPTGILYSGPEGDADFAICDAERFARVTGLSLKPGQLVQVRLVVVKK